MKKKIHIALIALLFGTSAFVVITKWNDTKTTAYYPLIERKGDQAKLAEWANTKTLGEKLIRIVRDEPDDMKNRIALATLYMQEARVTGEYNYYDGAAMTYVDEVLQKDPGHFDALTLKAMILLSQHHFAEALAIAKDAQLSNPYNAFVHGLMTDANVELGNYEEAVKNAEQMVSIRPDIRSYSRISYIREIHGDYEGAIEAMELAVKAGGYGDEATEWARIQLAKLYEHIGDVKNAETHYTIALEERPGYAYAIAGLAHLAGANKEYPKAIKLYEQADGIVKDHSFREELAKLYRLSGNEAKSKEILEGMVKEMEEGSKETGSNKAGHHADRELALLYLQMGDVNSALQYALSEYKQRPLNIDVNETVAWIYYKTGEAEKAIPFIETALRTNCKNPELLCRAGLIYEVTGDKMKAKHLIEQGLKNHAVVDVELQQECTRLSDQFK